MQAYSLGKVDYLIVSTGGRISCLVYTFHFHALEKEMATHSSVLAYRIPGTGKSGGLPSITELDGRVAIFGVTRAFQAG